MFGKKKAVTLLFIMVLVGSMYCNSFCATYSPSVKYVNSNTHPQIPSSLKVADEIVPVLVCNGNTYWAYSFNDNRLGMCIVKYDSKGNILNQWEKNGDRYLSSIHVDKAAQKVYFRGQYYDENLNSGGITMSFNELFNN